MKSIRWIAAGVFAFVVAGLFALGSARPARADAVVNPCTDAGLGTALASGGLITFNCGGPATITVTTDSRQINSTVVISGGNQITLVGSGISTFFWVRSGGGNLTLDGIRLTKANSDALFSDGPLTVRNSAVFANGGMFFARGGSALIENTSFFGNTGGALSDVNVTLRNVTMLSNTGTSAYYARGGTTTVSNTIFANSVPNCNGSFASAGYNISNDSSCNLSQSTDLPSANPLLQAAVLGYAAPAIGSPAIDAGVCLVTTDGRGQPRPGAGTQFCDIGAVEVQNVTVDLSAQSTAVPATALIGRPVTVTFVISNAGSGRVAAFAFTETLSSGLVNIVSTTLSSIGVAVTPTGQSASILSWSGTNMKQGARVTVTLVGASAATLTQSTLLTATTSTYVPADANAADNVASAVTLASFVPNLGLIKTVTPAYALPGERVTFTIAYSNSGFSPASGAITDVVPVTLTGPTANWTGPLTQVGGQTYAWTYGPLAVGEGGVITITGVLSGGLFGPHVFTNTAASATPGDVLPADDLSNAQVNLSSCFARANDGVTDGVLRFRIQDAIDDAAPGQLVKVAGYCIGQVTVAKSLTVRGGYTLSEWSAYDAALNPATLDAALAGRVAAFTSGSINIENLALVNGRVSSLDGAGVSVSSGVTATLIRVRVANNIASGFNADGAGVANNGTLVISASVVASNILSGSSSGRAGGIFNTGVLTLVNSSVLSNSHVAGSSNRGGGLFGAGAISIMNTTFAGNRADGFSHQGGAIYLESGNAILTNVTLAGNGVSGGSALGGAIFRLGGVMTLTNTLLDSNGGGNCAGSVVSGGYNLSSDGSCSLGLGSDLVNTPGLLAPLSGGHRAPADGSLAIDSGVCALSADALGGPRPAPGTPYCDIGAIETQSAAVDVAVIFASAPTQTVPARVITYTLVVSNVGSGRAASFGITLTLSPQYLNVISSTVLPASTALTLSSGTPTQLVWSGTNFIQGSALTLTVAGVTAYATANGSVIATSALVSGLADGVSGNNSAIAATTLLTQPNLALAKTVDGATVVPGARITFTIAYTNSGQAVANGIITDIVPVTLTQPVATWTGPLTPISGTNYAWQLAGLAPASGGVITIAGIVSATVGSDASFFNTATSSTIGDIVPDDDTSAAKASVQGCYARVYDGISDGPVRNVLQQAISEALPGQQVKLSGTCAERVTVTRTLTLRGGYATTNWSSADPVAYPATIDASYGGRAANITGGDVTLDGIGLINGRISGADGAGLSVSGGVTVTLLRARVVGNIASAFSADGGGISNNGTLVLSATTVALNAVSGSSSGKGGGIISTGVLTLVNSSILSNTHSGGSSDKGGGLFTSGVLAIVNSTFAGNRADGFAHQGGAIYVDSGNATLTNATLANNGVSGSSAAGGGIFRNGGVVTLTNTLLDANAGGNCQGAIVSLGYNMSSDATCALGAVTDLLNAPGQLGALSNGHRAPLLGSQAIDAGVCLQPADALGAPRPGSGSSYCDIGAIETQGTSVDLTTAVSVAPTRTLPGRAIGYAVVITNVGSGRSGSFVVTATYGAGLISVVSATVLPGIVSLTPTSAAGSTFVWAGTGLGVGGALTIYLTGTTPLTTSNATVITVTGAVRAVGDGVPGNDAGATSATVYVAPNLQVIKTTGPAVNLPGSRITFTIAYSNSGFSTASGIITDLVPVTLTQPTASWTGPLAQIGGPAFTWQLTSLAPGSGGVITVSGVISLGLGGDSSFTNTVVSLVSGDIVPEDDQSAARVAVQACYARAFDGSLDGPVRYTIQEALGDASPGQLVKVAGYCVGQMTITKTLTIRGGYATTSWVTSNAGLFPATLDALQTGRVAAVTGGVVAIEDMALINGRVSGADGGGLSVGAGVTVTVLRGRISGNAAASFNADGGGVANFGTLTLSNTQIVGNATSNSSSGKGGGIYSLGSLTIINASVLSNTNNDSSNKGGGLFASGTLVIVNSTFAGNRADGFDHHGGAIYFDGGKATLTNVTLAANGVSGFTSTVGGIFRNTGVMTLTNTLLSANDLGNCGSGLATGGYNLSSDASCALAASTDITKTAAPMLPMVMGHLAPAPGNPAIDHGQCLLPADALGAPRPGAGSAICDIGAIEVQFTVKRAFVPSAFR